MPPRTKPSIEKMAISLFQDGASDRTVAGMLGVCERTARAIKIRNGLGRGRVGRPCVKRHELTSEQSALVDEFIGLARQIAWGECREHSNRPEFDRDEYISTAYMALAIAASKWERRSSFKRFLRKCIKTSLAEFRRKEMLSNGWARNSGPGYSNGITQVMQITSMPRR